MVGEFAIGAQEASTQVKHIHTIAYLRMVLLPVQKCINCLLKGGIRLGAFH
jgi:hypothetical protein